MGFHLVYELSQRLYGGRGDGTGGYACLGKGKCPSSYHVNYRRNEHAEPERFDLVHTDGYALRHRWL